MPIKTGKEIPCAGCGNLFYIPACRIRSGRKCCSKACGYRLASESMRSPKHEAMIKRLIEASRRSAKRRRRGAFILCTECGVSIWRPPSRQKEKRCSKACANAYVSRLYKSRPDRKENLRRAATFIVYTDEMRKANSKRMKRLFAEGKIKKRTGASSPFWKGGIATLQNSERQKPTYKAWRKAVYERDEYRCRKCGMQKHLHAHHIKPFAGNPYLRYTISNGLTLCQKCHSIEHGRLIPDIGGVNKKV